jgi:hypothetical protein
VGKKIAKSDIQDARTQLGLKRAEMLRRHAEELSDLDAQLQDIERFDQIVAAFFEEYVSPEKAASDSEPPLPGEQDEHLNAPPEGLQIRHHLSGNFASFRRSSG